jgi:hypothetical protein
MNKSFSNQITLCSLLRDRNCNPDDFLYLEASKKGADIFINEEKKFGSNHSLNKCLKIVDSNKTETSEHEIIKVSRKYAFNFRMIETVSRKNNQVIFKDGQAVTIS